MTWAQLYADAAARLGSRHEARWLVEEVTGERWPPPSSSPGTAVTTRARTRFEGLLARRAAGEPLQYVLGRWQFRTLDLMLDRRVLIPRPETEQVVEAALAELDRMAALDRKRRQGRAADRDQAADPDRRAAKAPGPVGRLLAVDLGTGSGAIALSLVAERAHLEVWATDVSADALHVAGANLAGLGGRAAARVRLALGSWWAAVPGELRGRVDLIVSNPPYISSREMGTLGAEVVEWEPRLSLEAGATGLEAFGEILAGARQWLRPAGAVVVEIAPHQSAGVAQLAGQAGLEVAGVRPDLAGRDRALVARLPR